MGKKKPQHGGARAGAGRRPTNPEGKTVVVAASVPESLLAKLNSLAEVNEWSRSEAVTEAIRRLVN
jgi:hypothetical protein